MSKFHTLVLLTGSILLAGCARQIEGSYVNPEGAPAFRLANGKYYGTSVAAGEARLPHGMHSSAMPIPLPYKVDGARLIVQTRRGDRVMEILPDGALRATDAPVQYKRQ